MKIISETFQIEALQSIPIFLIETQIQIWILKLKFGFLEKEISLFARKEILRKNYYQSNNGMNFSIYKT